MQQGIPAHRPSTAGPAPSSTASHCIPQQATGNPFAGSPTKLSPGISPSNQVCTPSRWGQSPCALSLSLEWKFSALSKADPAMLQAQGSRSMIALKQLN